MLQQERPGKHVDNHGALGEHEDGGADGCEGPVGECEDGSLREVCEDEHGYEDCYTEHDAWEYAREHGRPEGRMTDEVEEPERWIEVGARDDALLGFLDGVYSMGAGCVDGGGHGW